MASEFSSEELYWLTEQVAVPQRLLDALNANSLVIFAGAGISIDPPSGLPTFAKLATLLSAQSGHTYIPGDDVAQFLGRISVSFNVHKQTHGHIADPTSSPNDLHRVIVELAASRGLPRVVTTNFDNHLTQAAQQLAIKFPNTWSAPALPIGSNFMGLVHLHGSIADGHEQLVLTDQDLGKAYLLDAWATRFLVPMFESFTVLFVGYSHTDPMMRYLGMALSSNLPRYALVEEAGADETLWKRLNIVPIKYPRTGSDHSALLQVLSSWLSLIRMGVTDHRSRMLEVIRSEQPLRPIDLSYLNQRFGVAEGIEDFVAITSDLDPASRANWLTWAESQANFQRLFNSNDPADSNWQLARWFGDQFVAVPSLSDRALETVERLGASFSNALFRSCVSAIDRLDNLDSVRARRWRAFLGTSVIGQTRPQSSQVLFQPSASPLYDETTSVLGSLIPYLQLRQGVVTRGAEFPLPQAEVHLQLQEEILSPILYSLARTTGPLASHVMCALENALLLSYELIDSWYGVPRFDVLSYRRSAIEDHEQDDFRFALSPVIDGLRDLGQMVAATDLNLIERWWGYERALFRRLCVYLKSQDLTVSPDERIRWVLDRDLLFDYETKHEVFALLRGALKDSSTDVRAELLSCSLAGATRNELDLYEIANLLFWITDVMPEWSDASEALSELLAKNPSFRKREHPDFNHWTGGMSFSDFPSISLDEMVQRLRESPNQFLEWMCALEDDGFPFVAPSRMGAFASLSQAISSFPELGHEFLQVLNFAKMTEEERQPFVASVLNGWSDAGVLDPLDAYLPWIAKSSHHPDLTEAVSRLILKIVEGSEQPLEMAHLDSLQKIALALWSRERDSFVIQGSESDHLVAPLFLNSWPGYLASFWVYAIGRRWTAEKDQWSGLNDIELSALSMVLDRSRNTFTAAMPALTIHLLFLYSADSDFTVTQVLTLFEDDSSLLEAWSSFLRSPRVSIALLRDGFKDRVVEFFGSLKFLKNEGLRRNFLSMIFDICCELPISDADRQKLLFATVTSDDGAFATEFAETVAFKLNHSTLNPEEVWDSWLANHLLERFEGRPRTAARVELETWADVVPLMGSRTSEVIRLVSAGPIGITRRSGIYLSEISMSAAARELVDFYTERIKRSDTSSEQLKWEVLRLIHLFSNELGQEAVQSMIEAAQGLGIAF